MNNRSLSEVFIGANRSRESLSRYLLENLYEVSQDVVDRWVKQFDRRWAKTHGVKRFFEDAANHVWLDTVFEFHGPDNANTFVSNELDVAALDVLEKDNRQKFDGFTEKTKDKYSQYLARNEPLDKLLRAAAKAARKNSNKYLAEILKRLREGREEFAADLVQLVEGRKIYSSSEEDSLIFKQKLRLSKREYVSVIDHTKKHQGFKLLVPWSCMVNFRNNIIPPFSAPNWSKGYLSTWVTLRDLVRSDIARLYELTNVKSNTITAAEKGEIKELNCILYVAAGPDGATGYSKYNQPRILDNDNSLLAEHYMPLKLTTDMGDELWRNPSPQSESFCKPKSLSWTKETKEIVYEMFMETFSEVALLNSDQIEFRISDVLLKIKVSLIYSLIDGKVANAIVGNTNTHQCPICVSDDPRLGPSFFHCRLNAVEWLINRAAQKSVGGKLALTHPLVKDEARSIANQLEAHFQMHVNRPKIGGCGSSNNGNTARKLLSEPVKFAEILGLKTATVQNLRIISSLALSSMKLDTQKVRDLCREFDQQIREEFPLISKVCPSIHKYQHLPDIAERLPYPMSFVDEQAGERCHKIYKFTRPNLARQLSPEENLHDIMVTALSSADIKISSMAFSRKTTHTTKDQHFQKQLSYYYATESRNNFPVEDDDVLIESDMEYSGSSSESSKNDD